MADRRFPILGTMVPPLVGREAILQRMTSALKKPVPDHLQVVGPRFSGKTVILHELAALLRQEGSPFSAVLIWDLGHQTPKDDVTFMRCFARELSQSLRRDFSVYADHLNAANEHPYSEIAEVLNVLKEEDVKVLAILDGFDKPLSNGQLTRTLWDQLRELAINPSLRLITASRRTLRELIRDPEAQTSDFWNIFELSPVRVGCFDERDLRAILSKLPDHEFLDGAATELWNATNGFPILMLEVLNSVCNLSTSSDITPASVITACEVAFPALRDNLDTLWSECSVSSQDLMHRVIEEDRVGRNTTVATDAEILIERGFIHATGNRLYRPNRLLKKYLQELPSECSAIVRLFGDEKPYLRNFKGVLERRLVHVNCTHSTLNRYLQRGIEDLPDHPRVFLSNVRGIVSQAFELIWKAELLNMCIPSAWLTAWNNNGERGIEKWGTSFPQGFHQVRLLQLMTGTEKSDPCAAYVTKETYLLINSVHAAGDFGQHLRGEKIDPGFAYSVLLQCLELAACLERELPKVN